MKKAKLGDICTIVSGSTPKTSKKEYWDGNLRWITPAEIADDSYFIYDTERYITEAGAMNAHLNLLPIGTVLLSSRAPIGKVAIAGAEMYCNQGFKNLICSPCVNNCYLYYYLKSKKDYLNSLGRGATFKEISRQIVSEIEIPLPELDEQQRIVRQFDLLAKLCNTKHQQIDLLELAVKSRFVEMFGDPIQLNHCNYSMEPMPKVCTIIDGDRGKNYPHDNDFSPEGYCLFLNTKNVTSSGFNFDHITFITKKKDLQLRKGKLNYGDVILTTRGTIGNLAYYSRDIPFSNVRINSGMVILRLNHELMNERFFMSQFKLKLPYILDNISSGSAQPQLPISTMDKIMMIVPPLELQENYAEFCKQIDKSRLAVQKSLDELEILKKSLMQQYFG
jgi:type I restriction enzyme S subunit